MDARKASFRAKLRQQQKSADKRIDSPLVRYNEYDQPMCRVCNITLKSESLWAGHQASRKHHEAVEAFKATAAGKSCAIAAQSYPPKELKKRQPSSTIPADFFDKQEPKRQKNDEKREVPSSVHLPINETNECSNALSMETVKKRNDADPSLLIQQQSKKFDGSAHKLGIRNLPKGFFEDGLNEDTSHIQHDEVSRPMSSKVKHVKGTLPESHFDSKGNEKSLHQLSQSSKIHDGSEVKQVKGTLPEGFFDNKDADLRARGIEPVKVDINDAYKEFEKEIQDDLQDVDDRLEEEEIDAAEMREEFESLEQHQYRQQVEMVKKRLIEVRAARHAKVQQPIAFMGQESSDESSSDSDNAEEDFTVDWRAKHL